MQPISSNLLPWTGAITGTLLAVVALARCRGSWGLKHIVGALALFTIPLLLFFNQGVSMDHQRRFDVPLTYQQAVSEAKIDFPLPASSRQINYAAFADWQVGGHYVRFIAPVADCLSHLETVTAWFNNMNKARNTWERTKIQPSSMLETSPRSTLLGTLPWFAADRIQNGIHLRPSSANEWGPEMWVDLDAGVFYYWYTK